MVAAALFGSDAGHGIFAWHRVLLHQMILAAHRHPLRTLNHTLGLEVDVLCDEDLVLGSRDASGRAVYAGDAFLQRSAGHRVVLVEKGRPRQMAHVASVTPLLYEPRSSSCRYLLYNKLFTLALFKSQGSQVYLVPVRRPPPSSGSYLCCSP